MVFLNTLRKKLQIENFLGHPLYCRNRLPCPTCLDLDLSLPRRGFCIALLFMGAYMFDL